MNNKREFHINVSACGSYFFKALYSMCAIIMIHELANVIHDNTSVISPSKWLKVRKLDKKNIYQNIVRKIT
tara:strand:- start:6 stop:218 length:213 start_codon:yes stop_codon:yes gene_type:complete